MKKYSVIIPTMLKSPRLTKLVNDIQSSEFVNEVIIIDNSGNSTPTLQPHPKQRYICEGKNIGVNPAWNKGVELAKNDLICISNDDLNFNPVIFQVISDGILNEHGIIGMGGGNYKKDFNHDVSLHLETWRPGMNDWGWGSLLFTLKSNWIPIPEDMIVWYGDNFIKEVNPVKKSVLRGFHIETEMSTTSDLPEFDEIKKQDLQNWVIHYNNKDKWKN